MAIQHWLADAQKKHEQEARASLRRLLQQRGGITLVCVCGWISWSRLPDWQYSCVKYADTAKKLSMQTVVLAMSQFIRNRCSSEGGDEILRRPSGAFLTTTTRLHLQGKIFQSQSAAWCRDITQSCTSAAKFGCTAL